MSYENALKNYRVINAVAYPILLTVVLFQVVPYACLLAFVGLYDYQKVYKASKEAPEDEESNDLLVSTAFTHNWHFGALLAIGYLVGTGLPLLL